jgi:hypothetical protein
VVENGLRFHAYADGLAAVAGKPAAGAFGCCCVRPERGACCHLAAAPVQSGGAQSAAKDVVV